MDQGSSSTSNSTCCLVAMEQSLPRPTQRTVRRQKEGRAYGAAKSSKRSANKIARLCSCLHLHRATLRIPDHPPRQLAYVLRSLFDDILWCCVRIYFVSIFLFVFCIPPCILSSIGSRIPNVLSRPESYCFIVFLVIMHHVLIVDI